MKQILTIIILLCVAAANSSEPCVVAGTVVAVPLETPISTGDSILLREVALLEGCPAEWKQRLSDAPIARSAAPGQSRVLQREDILTALKRVNYPGSIQWAGVGDITVAAASQIVTGESAVNAAVQAVQTFFARDPLLETSLETIFTPSDFNLRPGPVEFQTDFPSSGPQPGTQSLRVRVLQAHRKVSECMVTLRIRVTGQVAVALAPLHIGDLVSESNATTTRKELSWFELANRNSLATVLGLRARVEIQAGQPITRALVAEPLVIRRGDMVTVRMRTGALEITARGESKNDAARGEIVRVLIPQSEAEVSARATGSREARVGE